MLTAEFGVYAVVAEHYGVWRPFHIGFLFPLEWHAASCLHKRKYGFDIIPFSEEHLFCFGGIGGMPIEVTAATYPPGPLPPLIPPGEDDQLAGAPTECGEVNNNEPTNEPSDPLHGPNAIEILHPLRVVEVVLVAFAHGAATLDELLQATGQVVVVAVVELLLVEELHQSVDDGLVGFGGVGRQRHELHLVDLVDEAVVDLADH